MRITSGKYKGRKLLIPKINSKPTTSKSKIALFNILNHKICFNDVSVLDLFCGIGGVSFEFISRGVKEITCVDNNKKYIFLIKKNILLLNINQIKINVILNNVNMFIKTTNTIFDIIFLDPPYNYLFNNDLIHNMINLFFNKNIVNKYVILEHYYKFLDDVKQNKYYYFNKKYGKTCISFFK